MTPGRARRLMVPRTASCLGSAPGSPSSPQPLQRHPGEERYSVSEMSVSPMSTRSSHWCAASHTGPCTSVLYNADCLKALGMAVIIPTAAAAQDHSNQYKGCHYLRSPSILHSCYCAAAGPAPQAASQPQERLPAARSPPRAPARLRKLQQTTTRAQCALWSRGRLHPRVCPSAGCVSECSVRCGSWQAVIYLSRLPLRLPLITAGPTVAVATFETRQCVLKSDLSDVVVHRQLVTHCCALGLQADMDVDPRLSLRNIINLPSGDASRRPASAGDSGAAAGSPAKSASSPPPRPGSALSAASRGGSPGLASVSSSRGRDASHDMTSGLGGPQPGGFGGAAGFGGGGAGGHELLASFSFAPGMLAELQSPTMLSVPLEAAAAAGAVGAGLPAVDDPVVSAASQHATAPTAARTAARSTAAAAAKLPPAPEHVPAPRSFATGHRRALSAGGIVASRSAGDAGADAPLAALAGFARPSVQKKWQRRLTIEVPEPPSE